MRKTKSSDEKDFLIHHHFSQIAHAYDYLRTTDAAPIMFIAKRLEKLEHIGAIDIGCGTGRYDLLLFECLGPKLRLTCLDSNPNMLDALEQNFMNSGISDFASIEGVFYRINWYI